MASSATWFAPGRVNLIGEHTDYNDGLALPFALDRGCTAVATRTDGRGITISSQQRPTSVHLKGADLTPSAPWLRSADGWAGYAAGVLWALGDQQRQAGGWSIELTSDLPSGAGLSSSAAICCAVAGAIAEILEFPTDPDFVAKTATIAEQEFVGAPTGGMDQLAVTHGRPNGAVLCDMKGRKTTHVPLAVELAGLGFLVVDTGTSHALVDSEYAERRASCRRAAAQLGVEALRDATLDDLGRLTDELLARRARHVITENARVVDVARLLEDGRVADIGPLLTASHTSMRYDFEITVPRVDLAVETLLTHGALGARMTGGGFGGCVIGLMPLEEVRSAEHAVGAAFEASGLVGPTCFLARPSAGAGPRLGTGQRQRA